MGLVERFFDDGVAVADVLRGVVEVALDEALEHVEKDAVGFVVDAEDGAPEGEG